jgi:hypothetical protein
VPDPIVTVSRLTKRFGDIADVAATVRTSSAREIP